MTSPDTPITTIEKDSGPVSELRLVPQPLLKRFWAQSQVAIYPFLAVIVLIAIWQAIIVIFEVKPFILASPSQVLQAMVERWEPLVENLLPTLRAILGGYLLAIAIGIPLAVAIVSSRLFEQMVYPLLVVSQTVPQIAIAPLLIVWFGFGLLPKVLVAFVICFFPIVVNTATGLRSVPEELFDLATSMGGAKWAVFRKIRFPWALPNIFAGLKVGIALAVIGAIVGEFAGSDEGLGYLIRRAAGRADVAYVLASVAVLSMVGIIGFVLIDVLERVAIPWHTSRRHRGAARQDAAVHLDELQIEQHDHVTSNHQGAKR